MLYFQHSPHTGATMSLQEILDTLISAKEELRLIRSKDANVVYDATLKSRLDISIELLKKLVVDSKWRSIETAPKDGRHILFTRTNPWTPDDFVIGFWHIGQNIPSFVARGTGLKIDTSRWIYWRPLPELAEQIPGSREWRLLTNSGPMMIVALSLEEAEEIARRDGHIVYDGNWGN